MFVSGNHRQSQRHENAFSVPGCFPGAGGKCCKTKAEENAGIVARYLTFRERMEEVRRLAQGQETLLRELDAAMEIWEGD